MTFSKVALSTALGLSFLAWIRIGPFLASVATGKVPRLPEQIRNLRSFNDLGSFEASSNNPCILHYVESEGPLYLRFALKDIDLSCSRVVLTLRGRDEILDALDGRGTGPLPSHKERRDDLVIFTFDHIRNEDVLWSNGVSYIGVYAPKHVFKHGDRLELVDFSIHSKFP